MNENGMVLSSGADLMKQSKLYEPMLYYGAGARIAIDYVSDIHLLHHVKYYDNDIRKTVWAIARSLYQSRSNGIQVFLGDVSSNRDVTVAFYRQYRLNDMYQQYKRFKRSLTSEDDIVASERWYEEAKCRRTRLAALIAGKDAEAIRLKSDINEHVSYSKVISPKGGLEEIEHYLASNYYKRRNLPLSVTKKILAVASLEDEIQKLERSERHLCDSILNFECTKQQRYKASSLRNFKYEPVEPLGLVVLGNHEYRGFSDVNEAVEFYQNALEPLGYIVLQNSAVEND